MSEQCCVVSCCMKDESEENNHRSLFPFPKDEKSKMEWLNAVGPNLRKYRIDVKQLYICSKHFNSSCLHSNMQRVWKDGKKVDLPRKILRLKKNSVPSLFEEVIESMDCADSDFHNHMLQISESYRKPRDLSPTSSRKVTLLEKVLSLKSCNPTSRDNEKQLSDYCKEKLIEDWDSRNAENFPERWGINDSEEGVFFAYFGDIPNLPSRSIFVKQDMSVEIRIQNQLVNYPSYGEITKLEDLRVMMVEIVCLNICEMAWRGQCKNGFFKRKSKSQSLKCNDCQVKSKRAKNEKRRAAQRLLKRNLYEKKKKKNLNQKFNRAQVKMKAMEKNIEDLMDKCALVNEKSLEDSIKDLPLQMQEVIKTIHQYGKVDDKRGMRYSKRWILECILLSIKSRKAYLHLRNHNILPLPTFATLKNYLKNMKPRYGFDPQVFSILKKKGASMKAEDRRGVLVLDEMQISKGVSFDTQNLSVLGFTDLGEYTPEQQKTERADHALVFLFQPFRGQWVQNIAAFLSKGAANGDVLSHLVSECIIMLENSGFYVDVVTSDGGTWNRSMWKKFGLKDLDCSCMHITSLEESDNSGDIRRLWFCSDFSHLIKNIRNFLMAKEAVMTPDGVFKKNHFRAILKGDGGSKSFGLKVAHKLTPDHLDPKFFQKMHVHKAFDLFSVNVITAMEYYKENDKDLHDCEATVKLTSKIGNLITAMTARSSQNSLTEGNKNYKIIIEFREYLQRWRNETKEKDFVFMSDSTYVGFMVTLRASTEVMEFLCKNCGYKFLMTARLNQDALEGMFGMIRGCCGSTDKPEPLLFIQVYRLLSFYSLVKPPKGSNVDGLELFETLLSSKDVDVNESKDELKEVLDAIIERGENNKENYTVRHEHDYNVSNVNGIVLAYFSGFVARKVQNWTSCQACLDSLTKSNTNLPREKMINSLNRGYLKYPSDSLFNLLQAIERAILQVVGQEQLNFYIFQHIMKNILSEKITFVGCPDHVESLTKTIINYYAVARTKILCKTYNKVYNEAKKEEQRHRKMAKLIGKKDPLENYLSKGKSVMNAASKEKKLNKKKPLSERNINQDKPKDVTKRDLLREKNKETQRKLNTEENIAKAETKRKPRGKKSIETKAKTNMKENKVKNETNKKGQENETKEAKPKLMKSVPETLKKRKVLMDNVIGNLIPTKQIKISNQRETVKNEKQIGCKFIKARL